jgi:general stress protein YciG
MIPYMTDSIHDILVKVPHNYFQLCRYIKFITACEKANINTEIPLEKHHICPKAKGFFPEYADLKLHSWNLSKLTYRQHFIAHQILWKVYGGKMATAFWRMSKGGLGVANSKTYDKLRKDHSETIKTTGFASQSFEFRSEKSKNYIKENPEKHSDMCKLGGAKSQELHGSHFSSYTKEQRLDYANRGNEKLKELGLNFYSKEFQSEMGKRGGKAHAGSRTYNDGIREYKYKGNDFDGFLSTNPRFVAGRIVKYYTCPHCNTVGTMVLMNRRHFDKCSSNVPPISIIDQQ